MQGLATRSRVAQSTMATPLASSWASSRPGQWFTLHPPRVVSWRRTVSHKHGPRVCRASITRSPPDVSLKFNTLGNSDLQVSEACLGTMMFGSQISEQDAEKVLDYAWECGMNFLDTAEMYSIPPKPDTHGNSSRIVGNWMKDRRREDIVVATKVAGRSKTLQWIGANRTTPPGREEELRVDRKSMKAAVEGELRRLRTDYIDILQIHWPDRCAGAALTFECLLRALACCTFVLGSCKRRHYGE